MYVCSNVAIKWKKKVSDKVPSNGKKKKRKGKAQGE